MYIEDDDEKKHLLKCKLLDGTITDYDACSKTLDHYNPEIFTLIGRGIIYSVDKVIQYGFSLDNPEDLRYFYVKDYGIKK